MEESWVECEVRVWESRTRPVFCDRILLVFLLLVLLLVLHFFFREKTHKADKSVRSDCVFASYRVISVLSWFVVGSADVFYQKQDKYLSIYISSVPCHGVSRGWTGGWGRLVGAVAGGGRGVKR